LQNAWLDEAPVGIKIVKRNTNNLRYADDTNLVAESEEEGLQKGRECLVGQPEVSMSSYFLTTEQYFDY